MRAVEAAAGGLHSPLLFSALLRVLRGSLFQIWMFSGFRIAIPKTIDARKKVSRIPKAPPGSMRRSRSGYWKVTEPIGDSAGKVGSAGQSHELQKLDTRSGCM